MKYREKIVLTLSCMGGILIIVPYVVDVFSNNVTNYFDYINPLKIISFYQSNPQVIVLVILVTLLGWMFASTQGQGRLLVDEDVSREATEKEIRQAFCTIDISKPIIAYKNSNMEKLPCNETEEQV